MNESAFGDDTFFCFKTITAKSAEMAEKAVIFNVFGEIILTFTA